MQQGLPLKRCLHSIIQGDLSKTLQHIISFYFVFWQYFLLILVSVESPDVDGSNEPLTSEKYWRNPEIQPFFGGIYFWPRAEKAEKIRAKFLAPIENFWSELKHRVYSKGRPETMRILKARVRKECRNPDWFPWLTAAFDSLPQRMQDVIDAKGGHTKWWNWFWWCFKRFWT